MEQRRASQPFSVPNYPSAYVLAIALVMTAGLTLSRLAIAETRTVRGLTIPVDEVTEVDGKNSRVVIDGKPVIVPTETVDSLILERALSSAQTVQRLSLSALMEFALGSIEAGDYRAAGLATGAVVVHRKASADMVRELVQKAAEVPAIKEALRKTAEDDLTWSTINTPMKVMMLFEIGLADPAWIKQKMLGTVMANREAFRAYARSSFEGAIQGKRFARLPLITSLLRDLFGVEDSQFQELRIIADQLSRFHQALEKGDAHALEIAMVSLKSDQQFKSSLYPYLADQIHTVSRAEIDAGTAGKALQLLSLVDLSFRTPTTHNLLKLGLERLGSKELAILDSPSVKRFLLSMSQFDAELKSAFEGHLVSQFNASLRQGDYAQADRALETLTLLRPDPDQRNDELRIEYARIMREQGDPARSQVLLRDVRTGIPFMVRLELFSLDVLGITLFLFLSIVASGTILMALIIIRYLDSPGRAKRVSKKPKREEEQEDWEEDEEGEFAGPVFRRMDKPKISAERKEYLHCLTVFNLEPNASFKEIRQAYRSAVKAHHPDRQGEGVASDRFVNLNQTYERIIELRKILGISED